MIIYINEKAYECTRFERFLGFSPIYGGYLVQCFVFTIGGMVDINLNENYAVRLVEGQNVILEGSYICDKVIIEPNSNRSLVRFIGI